MSSMPYLRFSLLSASTQSPGLGRGFFVAAHAENCAGRNPPPRGSLKLNKTA
jgi:hypothetical protein